MPDKITVELPKGKYCRIEGVKTCWFARYVKRYGAYNCAYYNKLLKGGETPKKCRECAEYTEMKEGY